MSVKLLLYCIKAKPYLYKPYEYDCFEQDETSGFYLANKSMLKEDVLLNGKIVAECECEKVESFNCCVVPYRKENNLGYELFVDNGVYKVEWKENINLRDENKQYNNPENYKDCGVVFERKDRYINTMLKNDDLGKAKITPQELLDYIGLGNEGYALHLSNVKVFDEPKELKDYSVNNPLFENIEMFGWMFEDVAHYISLTKAPQNMCNVYDNQGNHYILISIRPEHLCKILNGEKTIEVRKKVLNSLKEMLEDE